MTRTVRALLTVGAIVVGYVAAPPLLPLIGFTIPKQVQALSILTLVLISVLIICSPIKSRAMAKADDVATIPEIVSIDTRGLEVNIALPAPLWDAVTEQNAHVPPKNNPVWAPIDIKVDNLQHGKHYT